MIQIDKTHSISNFIVTSALGTSGTGIPIYKIFPYYRDILKLIRETGTTGITKSLTPEKHTGNVLPFSIFNPFPFLFSARKFIKRIPKKCFAESNIDESIPRKGLVNAYGLTNQGIEIEAKKIRAGVKEGFHTIPGIYGGCTPLELQESLLLLEKILGSYFFAFEMEFCPHIFQTSSWENIFSNVSLAKKLFPEKYLIVKLNYPWPPEIAQELEKAGANCFHAINSVAWNDIFYHSKSLLSADFQGSVSGPAIKPKSVRFNKKLRQATDLPIIMGGGIWNLQDTEEFFALGADAVSGCLLITDNPKEAKKIIQTLNC